MYVLACIPLYGDRGRDICCDPADSQENAPELGVGCELAIKNAPLSDRQPMADIRLLIYCADQLGTCFHRGSLYTHTRLHGGVKEDRCHHRLNLGSHSSAGTRSGVSPPAPRRLGGPRLTAPPANQSSQRESLQHESRYNQAKREVDSLAPLRKHSSTRQRIRHGYRRCREVAVKCPIRLDRLDEASSFFPSIAGGVSSKKELRFALKLSDHVQVVHVDK